MADKYETDPFAKRLIVILIGAAALVMIYTGVTSASMPAYIVGAVLVIATAALALKWFRRT